MNKGDKVTVVDDDIIGVVITINKSLITILTEDGFEMEYDKNELILAEHLDEKELFSKTSSKYSPEGQVEEKNNSKKVSSKRKKPVPLEIDLHIHHHTENSGNMTNHEMLTLQLDVAKNKLNFAIRNRINKIVFIHGVGQGVLRKELEFLLKKYDNITFYDANYQKYGRGALEVYIYQNKKSY